MKFHHIGIACDNLHELESYLSTVMSAQAVTTQIFDPKQNAYLQMFSMNDGTLIEGISGDVVKNIVKRQNYLYHTCFEVEDIHKCIQDFVNEGGLIVSEVKEAILFNNRKVAFIYTKLGLVELLEVSND